MFFFQKRPACALIGACAVNGSNTINIVVLQKFKNKAVYIEGSTKMNFIRLPYAQFEHWLVVV